MRPVVCDSSCLFDLKEAGLLAKLGDLPYSFVFLDMAIRELLSFSRTDMQILNSSNATNSKLSGQQEKQAQKLAATNSRLSYTDCALLIYARRESGSILLTGDQHLRQEAKNLSQSAHGTIWVLDKMLKTGIVEKNAMKIALQKLSQHPNTYLPKDSIEKLMQRCK